jgi:ERF superfamily.
MADNKEKSKLNIYGKIQKCKVELSKKKMKKSGKNQYAGYEYFELEDFLPYVFQAEFEVGLYSKFEFNLERATLKIVDTESIDGEFELFSIPVQLVSMKGCNEMQNIASTQSYCERYLYQIAYGIAENDTVNGGEVDEDAELGKKKIDQAAVKTIKKLIAETNSKEAEFCSWAKVKKVEDIINKNLPICMKKLNEKKESILAEKSNEMPKELNL